MDSFSWARKTLDAFALDALQIVLFALTPQLAAWMKSQCFYKCTFFLADIPTSYVDDLLSGFYLAMCSLGQLPDCSSKLPSSISGTECRNNNYLGPEFRCEPECPSDHYYQPPESLQQIASWPQTQVKKISQNDS